MTVTTDIDINCQVRWYNEKKQIIKRLYSLLGNDELSLETPGRIMNIQLGNTMCDTEFVSESCLSRLQDWLMFVRELHSEPELWDGWLYTMVMHVLLIIGVEERAAHWPWIIKLV